MYSHLLALGAGRNGFGAGRSGTLRGLAACCAAPMPDMPSGAGDDAECPNALHRPAPNAPCPALPRLTKPNRSSTPLCGTSLCWRTRWAGGARRSSCATTPCCERWSGGEGSMHSALLAGCSVDAGLALGQDLVATVPSACAPHAFLTQRCGLTPLPNRALFHVLQITALTPASHPPHPPPAGSSPSCLSSARRRCSTGCPTSTSAGEVLSGCLLRCLAAQGCLCGSTIHADPNRCAGRATVSWHLWR